MSKPEERIGELEQRVTTLVRAQGAQFTSLLKRIDEFEKRTEARFTLLETRLDAIDKALGNIQAVLQPMAFLLRKIAGDNPDANYERHGHE